MANLSNAQTDLLKYLHSQLLETQTSLNHSTIDLAYWTQCKTELSEDDAFHITCDWEINKAKTNMASLQHRFSWLVPQLEGYVPSLD